MNEHLRGVPRFSTFVVLALIVGGAGSCNNGGGSDVVRAAASCGTNPAGANIQIDQGDAFDIALTGSVPCTGGGGAVVICGQATFEATVNQSRFLNAGVLDQWSAGPGLGVQRTLAMSTAAWLGSDDVRIDVTSNQTGAEVLAQCDFNLTVRLPAPEPSSPNVPRGGSTCGTSLSVQWTRQSDDTSLAGYSYALVDQDDPNYDALRWPDTTVDLAPDVTSFTTPPLAPGRTWEFNLLPIDTLGVGARFYSSFWASIEDCAVTVTWPRDGDSYAPGEWVQIYWNLPILWQGNDVSGAYQVATVELLDPAGGAVVVATNLPNIGNNGFAVPSTAATGTGYRIRMTFQRTTNVVPNLPSELIGLSGTFAVGP